MSLPLEFGLLAFSSLFAVVNPIAAAPVFVALTKSAEARQRRSIALRATLTALLAMLLFSLAGGAIFSFFHITVPAFQIAGGILFLMMAIKTLESGDEREAEATPGDPSVVPLGIPLIAGAGALSTVTVLAGQAPGALHRLALGGAILATAVATLVILLISPLLVSRLGSAGQTIIAKLMGLLEAVIGVQFMINGVSTIVMELMKS
jgi:multiple antibiotic resistance protein